MLKLKNTNIKARTKESEIQSLSEHLQNVMKLAERNCPVKDLTNISVLTALMHDVGKIDPDFQEYIKITQKAGARYNACDLSHSIAGANILEKTAPVLSMKMAATAVRSSHGLKDMIDFHTGRYLTEKSVCDNLPDIKNTFFKMADKTQFQDLIKAANTDCNHMRLWIDDIVKKNPDCGKNQFYIGLMERLLVSVLYDSDWKDAGRFDSGRKRLPVRQNNQKIWDKKRTAFEKYMDIHKNELSDIQKAVLNACFVADIKNEKRMLMNVPETAGKFHGIFRFALSRAVYHGTQHIFYISPYNSDLVTAGTLLKNISGNRNILKYYSSSEKVKDEMEYKMEDWENPIILTSIVKFLDSLYSDKKPDVRRMQALCNSVIIIDNIRSIPLKCRELFNLAVNFLSEFCGCTVILCTDLYDKKISYCKENNLMECKKLVDLEAMNYVPEAAEIEYEDLTGKGQIDKDSFLELITSDINGSALINLRTRTAARNMYSSLKKRFPGYPIFYICGNMTMEHRLRKIKEMKDYQRNGYEFLCVTTCPRLFNGLRFSHIFSNIDGLEKLLSLEKYCENIGKISIVHFSDRIDKESVIPYKTISAMQLLLYEIRKGFIQKLNSPEAMARYDQLCNNEIPENLTAYPVKVMGCDTTLIRLLGSNPDGLDIYRQAYRKNPDTPLVQAFRTAGESFHVVENQDIVIVPYDNKSKKYLDNYIRGIKEREMLNKLQKYSVSISEEKILNNPEKYLFYEDIMVAKEDYYEQETGMKF